MIYYFFNPRKQCLLAMDSENKEISIMERLENVSVFTSDGDVQLGDFDNEETAGQKKHKIAILKKVHTNFKKKHKGKRVGGSKSEQIRELISKGEMSAKEIAEEVGTGVGSVYVIKSNMKKSGGLAKSEKTENDDEIDRAIIDDVLERVDTRIARKETD